MRIRQALHVLRDGGRVQTMVGGKKTGVTLGFLDSLGYEQKRAFLEKAFVPPREKPKPHQKKEWTSPWIPKDT